jgi:hypothetical protein
MSQVAGTRSRQGFAHGHAGARNRIKSAVYAGQLGFYDTVVLAAIDSGQTPDLSIRHWTGNKTKRFIERSILELLHVFSVSAVFSRSNIPTPFPFTRYWSWPEIFLNAGRQGFFRAPFKNDCAATLIS